MKPIRNLFVKLVLLSLLLAIELAMVLVPHAHSFGNFVLVPAGLMVVIVALAFMDLRQGPTDVYLFVAGGARWLTGTLGSRHDGSSHAHDVLCAEVLRTSPAK